LTYKEIFDLGFVPGSIMIFLVTLR
jgi:hypothetical protein